MKHINHDRSDQIEKARSNSFIVTNIINFSHATNFKEQSIVQYFNSGALPLQYFFVGDEAFSCTEQLLVPYSGRGLGTWKDSFNYHLSSMRQCIERAFGLMVHRWGILARPLQCAFNKWPLLLTVLAKLHNFCVDRNLPHLDTRYRKDVLPGDVTTFLLNEQISDPNVPRGHNKRTAFAAELEALGVRRPPHARCNSRE